jgi:hypothetical protein
VDLDYELRLITPRIRLQLAVERFLRAVVSYLDCEAYMDSEAGRFR